MTHDFLIDQSIKENLEVGGFIFYCIFGVVVEMNQAISLRIHKSLGKIFLQEGKFILHNFRGADVRSETAPTVHLESTEAVPFFLPSWRPPA